MIKIKARKATGITEKIIGLIGQKKLFPLFLKTRWGIHTFGMKIPLDIIVLNNEYKIVRIKKNLKPKRFFFWPPIYNKVLELPLKFSQQNKLRLGQKITVDFFS